MSNGAQTYDYIVVGAGSAGCVIAARLSENPDTQVLLIEGGGQPDHPDVANPSKWPTLFYGDMDWGWTTAPMRSCNNRIDHVPRGKMLGGCHSHNASAWVRGHPEDFNHWAYQGCNGWSWNHVLPIYKKIENWQGTTHELRGTGGPMWIEPALNPNPVAQAFVEAGPHVGLPIIEDYNAGDMEGTTYFNMTIKNGVRNSVYHAYLEPALNRDNLSVVTNAEVSKLIINDGQCTGVEYVQNGSVCTANANSEVIVSAGVIGSAKLLLLSGIGPADELEKLGIKVNQHLPGVGKNLHDHPLLAGINYECKGPLPAPSNNGAESTLWARSNSNRSTPDIQPVVIEFPLATPTVADQMPNDNCYAISPSVVRVASRGSVTLTSADTKDAPIIDVNFLSCQADMDAMLYAVELCRELGDAPAFRDLKAKEVMPGPVGRKDMIEFIKNTVSTYFHPVGTCKMGIDEMAVVDPKLKVYGIENLRVADASIMPTVTSGNTNAPSVMIGEQLAAFVR